MNQPEGNVVNQPVVVPLDLRDHQHPPDLQDPQDLQEESQKRDLIFFEQSLPKRSTKYEHAQLSFTRKRTKRQTKREARQEKLRHLTGSGNDVKRSAIFPSME